MIPLYAKDWKMMGLSVSSFIQSTNFYWHQIYTRWCSKLLLRNEGKENKRKMEVKIVYQDQVRRVAKIKMPGPYLNPLNHCLPGISCASSQGIGVSRRVKGFLASDERITYWWKFHSLWAKAEHQARVFLAGGLIWWQVCVLHLHEGTGSRQRHQGY